MLRTSNDFSAKVYMAHLAPDKEMKIGKPLLNHKLKPKPKVSPSPIPSPFPESTDHDS